MKKISSDTKLADIITENETLIPVLNRFGIKLGVGDKSIKSVCREAHIHSDLLVCIINTLTDAHYNPTETLQTFSVLQLVEYLKKENSYFEQELVIIEKHINAFVKKSADKNDSLHLLQKIFGEFYRQMTSFIQQKETVLFPEIIRIYENYYSPQDKKKNDKTTLFSDNGANAIFEKLSDIKKLLIKHIGGEYDENLFYSIVRFLSHFEKEIYNQQQIEKRILKSIVEEMQKAQKQQSQKEKTGFNTHIVISPSKNDILSPREKEVVKLVSTGFINKEIAEELQISLHTVISHRKNITEKLSIKTVSGLTTYAIMNGII